MEVFGYKPILSCYLPSQFGNPLNPSAQASHCLPTTFGLQGHCPPSFLQIKLVDPCLLQLQSKMNGTLSEET